MLHSRQVSVSSLNRDAWVEIDLSSIEENVRKILAWLANTNPKPGLMAVVKSDAYGHGGPAVAEVVVAAGAQWLGVASVDEGCQLRSAGIKSKILILSPTPFWAIENALKDDLDMTVASIQEVKDIERMAARHKRKASVHLKIDSGMHRLGAQPDAAPGIIDEMMKLSNLQLVSIFSHLAQAADRDATLRQLSVFQPVVKSVIEKSGKRAPFAHIASSEATRHFPETHLDMVRVGLYLYGLEARQVSHELNAAMSVRARINHISTIKEGECAGYNLTWEAKRESRLASIPIGYADGVDRRLSNRLTGLLFGHEIKQAGLISMDQMLFDITDVPEAQCGDVITLIGREAPALRSKNRAQEEKCLHLATWAQMLDTITYELACRLRARLPKIYTRHHHAEAHASMPEAKGTRQGASSLPGNVEPG